MGAVLHVISDRTRHRLPLLEALSLAGKGGADIIQIREKKAPAAETYTLALELQRELAEIAHGPAIFVNDRVDIALAMPLDGVHLASKSLPLPVVCQLRERVGWGGQIGCSVHSLEEAMAAEQAGADYITFGHIFASESHAGVPPRGVYALQRIVNAVSIPVVAIGGIDRTNIQPVLASGCSGVAVIGAVLNAADPLEETRALKRAIEQCGCVPKVPFSATRKEGFNGESL